MSKEKNKKYAVQAKLSLSVCIETDGKNITEVLEKSKSLNESSFVKVLGDYLDGEFEITGIYELG